METLQQFLTIAIEATAVIGFGGIAAHAIWLNHCNWCAEYLSDVMPFEEYVAQNLIKTEPAPNLNKIEPTPNLNKIESTPNLIKTEEPVSLIKTEEPASLIKTEPALNLIKIEEPANLNKTEEVAAGIALNKTLDTYQLRELCDRHRIQWRHYRGKGRHMPKAVMAASLAASS